VPIVSRIFAAVVYDLYATKNNSDRAPTPKEGTRPEFLVIFSLWGRKAPHTPLWGKIKKRDF